MSESEASSSLLKFPCSFSIKVFGPAGVDFQAATLTVIRKHAPDLGEGAVTSRLSKGDHYQAITVTIHATSQEQLDAIYRELKADKKVIMVL